MPIPNVPEVEPTQQVSAPVPIGTHARSTDSATEHTTQWKRPSSSGTRKPPKRRGRGPLIALIIVVVLLVVVYAGGALVFSNLFYPNTVIAGADVSLLDAGSAAARIRSVVSRYSLTVEGADFSWTYEPETSDAFIDAESTASELLKGNEPLAWPVRLFEALTATTEEAEADADTDVDLTVVPDLSFLSSSFDLDAFEESLGEAIDSYNEGRSGTFDVESAYDEETGTFSLDNVKANQRLDREAVIAYAEISLSTLTQDASLDVVSDQVYIPLAGSHTDDEIEAACTAANELLACNLTLTLGGTEVETVTSDQIIDWITFDDDDLSPSLDLDAINAWTDEIDDDLDTVGTTRTYTREDGERVTVSGGTFGWITDSDALADAIAEAIEGGESGELAIPTKQEGDVFTAQGERDWGAYIDIDISEQYARYYDTDGSILWESGVITGNPTLGNDTPTGVYYINNKARNITLVGQDDPDTGEPEYETPVEYWMAFVGSSVGLHDADWQSSSNFGDPDAYKSIGSHGCVNLPPDKAKELYEILEVGVCVIVHN